MVKKQRKSHGPSPNASISGVRPAERILMDCMGEIAGPRVLCSSLGRGQLARCAAEALPYGTVCCCLFDLYSALRAKEDCPDEPTNLRWECASDFPQDEFDAFLYPTTAGGEAELVREFLQSGHQRLRIGGTMFVATDNPSDSWLHDELRKLAPKVTRRPLVNGVLYVLEKTQPLRKVKNFECRFAFRDHGTLFSIVTRPGVFSHRSLDGGARALLNSAIVQSGNRILELGCGAAAVSIALAKRADQVRVDALDSNLRAVECARNGVELNALSNVAVHAALAESEPGGAVPADAYDLVVANPPYFSNNRIAEIFSRCAAGALKPGGTALFVTKRTEWYQERFPALFRSVAIEPGPNYQIVRAQKPLCPAAGQRPT